MSTERSLLEAALFMSSRALSVDELKEVLTGKTYSEAKQLAFDLMREFNERNSALEIAELDGSFQMRVKPEYTQHVSHLASAAKFHKGIMKTLAFIAFKQPIIQSTVIKYRNNKAYDHISQLVGEGFVAREPRGRSYVLRTTRKFLEYFGEDFKNPAKQNIQLSE